MCIYMYSPLLKFYVNAPKALVLLSCHCKEFAKFLASFIHLPVLVCTGKPINTNHVVFVCMPVFLYVVCVCHCVCAAPHDHNLGNNNRFESAFTGITVCSTHFVHECTAYPAVQHAKYMCWELQYSGRSESRVFISGNIATAGEPRLGLNVWLIHTLPSVQSSVVSDHEEWVYPATQRSLEL